MYIASISPSTFHKIASVSGVLAIGAGAYGFHVSPWKPEDDKRFKESFMIANLFHHIHNLALLSVSFAQRPNLFGSLICGGIVLFSGSCYLVGIKEDKSFGKLAPVGGLLFMAGWLAFGF